MDETPVKVGNNKVKGRMNEGYFWGIYGDESEVGFHYSPSRASPVLKEILGPDFEGVVQSDGHSAYNKYSKEVTAVTHAECWSHTRRNFIKAQDSQPELASIVLDYIGKAYHEEAKIRGADDVTILKARGEKVKPWIDKIFEWLKTTYKSRTLLPTDPFTKAASYALEREQKLRVFLDNPAVPMDTNHLERQIRPVAIGRKNWLLCWKKIGAKYAAIVYSLIATCKLHDVNTYHYLVDVLLRVSKISQHNVLLLTPRLWKQNFNHERLISAVDWPEPPA